MSYAFIKIAASNPALCYKFPQDDKDACLGWVAEERNDSSICFEIQKLNGRGSKNTCIYNVARKKHDVNLCKKISNSEKSNGTDHNSDYCLMAIAGDQGDPKICDQIQMITGPEFDDPAKAEDIASKERCYAEVGVTINDKFLCEKSGKYRDLCLKNIK